MILNNAPQAEAIVSNVGQIGEFRIRNSAKAFNILSSGLYANKIKAIIRELSCNALDSHVAAGNDAPFEVHLPTTLEPYFYIRDFGTGLNHDQVTNIYTTYFESTKTNSNDYIGALGLGSKSPFSYTDNFTVTAIKDGRKGIYTAFINDSGVPSIALMTEETTDEPAGVEVRFAVTDRYDFSKFADEARKVYRWFKQQPKIVGAVVVIDKPEYETENIIPGVHSVGQSYTSVAVMGNIAYPIDVPNATENLGDLANLVRCGLVMEFGIGELDFQASREGLSYIPLTIESIRKKLQQVNDALTVVIAKEANAIDNLWKRSKFLYSKRQMALWKPAVLQYAKDTNFPLMLNVDSYRRSHEIEMLTAAIGKFNIQVKAFRHRRNEKACPVIKTSSQNFGNVGPDGKTLFEEYYRVEVDPSTLFVINDLKVGALERAKYHFRKNGEDKHWSRDIFVLDKIDKTKPMDTAAFFKMLHTPPAEQIYAASKLEEKPRAASTGGIGKNVTILSLQERGGSSWQRASKELVWRPGGTLDDFDDNKTFYYVPMNGFVPQFTKVPSYVGVHELVALLKDTKMDQFNIPVYGVRKGDLPTILTKKNWVNLETFLVDEVTKLGNKIDMATVMERIAKSSIFDYNMNLVASKIDNVNSPANTLLTAFAGLPKLDGVFYLRKLMGLFGIQSATNVDALVVKYNQDVERFGERYPLISKLYRANYSDVAGYINLVDTVKGV